jgi:PEP-CTERM motif-containing protein
MKRLSLLCLLALTLTTVTMANIIPTSTTITGTGPFTWTYNLQLSKDQNVNSGFAPTSNPVPHTNLTFAGFFTIYDFAGYEAGSCAGPAGWTCSAQMLGFTPDDVVPTDNPNIVNITWAYTNGATILGQPSGVGLGDFSAQSIYNSPTLVSYSGRGIANSGPQIGTIADNVGNTQGPTPTPEPTTLALFGAGILAGAFRLKSIWTVER